MKVILWGLAMAMLGFYLGYQHGNMAITHQYETQQVCDRGRQTGVLNDCQTVQTKYNTEYLCQSQAPDAVCWVEVK